jgi:hypothetical protein
VLTRATPANVATAFARAAASMGFATVYVAFVSRYRADMAVRDDVQRVSWALTKLRAGYIRRLEALGGALTICSGEAARQIAEFVDRIADLTTAERDALFGETFGQSAIAGTQPLAQRLARRRTSGAEARMALDERTSSM